MVLLTRKEAAAQLRISLELLDQLRFFDTLRGHMIDGAVVKDGEDAFTFR